MRDIRPLTNWSLFRHHWLPWDMTRIEFAGTTLGIMPNILKSSSSEPPPLPQGGETANPRQGGAPQGWLRVGVIAAASAVLGGLAAAWFHRRTLSQLREAENEIPDSVPNITENETEEDF